MIFVLRLAIALCLAASPALAGSVPGFDWREDTIAFSNDTAFQYGIDERGELLISRRDEPAEYAHRCFVLARAVMQFHQFARFEPGAPRLSREEYREIIRRVSRVPVWAADRAPSRRIVVPGYAGLREFSAAYEGLMKEELGNWLPTYLRVGNWRLMMPFPRAGQTAAALRMAAAIDRGELQAVYISRFPKMNHVVVLFGFRVSRGGDVIFDAYDPNYAEEKTWLRYGADARSFDFPERWYFPGGRVNLFRVYLSPLH